MLGKGQGYPAVFRPPDKYLRLWGILGRVGRDPVTDEQQPVLTQVKQPGGIQPAIPFIIGILLNDLFVSPV